MLPLRRCPAFKNEVVRTTADPSRSGMKFGSAPCSHSTLSPKCGGGRLRLSVGVVLFDMALTHLTNQVGKAIAWPGGVARSAVVVVQGIHWNNHPACADLVAYAAFLDRAVTPPGQEGQWLSPFDDSSILMPLQTRPLPGQSFTSGKSRIVVKQNRKEGRKMNNQLKTRHASMDSGLCSAQFRF